MKCYCIYTAHLMCFMFTELFKLITLVQHILIGWQSKLSYLILSKTISCPVYGEQLHHILSSLRTTFPVQFTCNISCPVYGQHFLSSLRATFPVQFTGNISCPIYVQHFLSSLRATTRSFPVQFTCNISCPVQGHQQDHFLSSLRATTRPFPVQFTGNISCPVYGQHFLSSIRATFPVQFTCNNQKCLYFLFLFVIYNLLRHNL